MSDVRQPMGDLADREVRLVIDSRIALLVERLNDPNMRTPDQLKRGIRTRARLIRDAFDFLGKSVEVHAARVEEHDRFMTEPTPEPT